MIKKIISGIVIGILLAVSSVTIAPKEVRAKKLSAEAKQAKKDERKYKLAQKKLKAVQDYLDRGNLASAKRNIETAKRYYGNFSESFKKRKEIRNYKSKLDAIEKKITEIEKAEANRLQGKEEVHKLSRQEYPKAIRPHSQTLFMLFAGKTKNMRGFTLRDVKKLQEAWDRLGPFEAEFKIKFKKLIEANPNYAYDNISVNDVLDLLGNRKAYRDEFVKMACSQELDKMISFLDEMFSEVETSARIKEVYLDGLYTNNQQESGVAKKVLPYYQWIGKSIPKEKLDAVNGYKPKLKKMLAIAAKKNKFDKSQYKYKTKEIEKAAAAYGKEWKLIKVAKTSKNAWKITKNSLGIPLHRTSSGFAVYQVKGEPFKRGYKVGFHSVYNGKGYDAISSITRSNEVYPMK
jgi:hypothetical protein